MLSCADQFSESFEPGKWWSVRIFLALGIKDYP
jgi:hypothetical protein